MRDYNWCRSDAGPIGTADCAQRTLIYNHFPPSKAAKSLMETSSSRVLSTSHGSSERDMKASKRLKKRSTKVSKDTPAPDIPSKRSRTLSRQTTLSARRNSVLLVAEDFEVEIDYHENTGAEKSPKWISFWARKLPFGKKRRSGLAGDKSECQEPRISNAPRVVTLAEQLREAQLDNLDKSEAKVYPIT